MALSTEEAISLLTNTIKNNTTHDNYERVTELADLYKKLITGDKIETLLRQYDAREDDVAFAQRVDLTNSITPAVAARIMSPFNKVGRLDNVLKRIEYTDDGSDAKKETLKEKLKTFFGDADLNKYLETRFTQLTFTDPNSFIVIEFDAFDSNVESADPYPFEVSSEQAINYHYTNNVLDYLLVKLPITFTTNETGKGATEKDGSKYILYNGDNVYRLTEIDPKGHTEGVRNTVINGFDVIVLATKEKAFILDFFEPNAGQVQAFRVGYIHDLVTDGKTFVSPMQPAIPRFLKTIKTVSELDLTMAKHAYPQKLQYVEKCAGDGAQSCNKGIASGTGATCTACKGSGKQIHTSSQDVITMPMPRDKEDMFPLDGMLVYKSPPVELVKFQKEYTDALESKAIEDVFNSKAFTKETNAETATRARVDRDDVNDTLYPFTTQYSNAFIKFVRLTAIFTDTDSGLIVEHRFNKDLKLSSQSELINDIRQATESGAPVFVINELSNDLASKMFIDSPDKLQMIKVKSLHNPFAGKSLTEIQFIIGAGLAKKESVTLWANFDEVFKIIESENPEFYLMTFERRQAIVNSVVERFQSEIDTDNTATLFPAIED